jgi:hypothetical protein
MNLKNAAIEHSPAEPEPKVHDRLDRAVRLFLRGLSPPYPRDTKARNFSAVRRFRTLVSQSTRAPEEETRRYVEISKCLLGDRSKEFNSFSALVLWSL